MGKDLGVVLSVRHFLPAAERRKNVAHGAAQQAVGVGQTKRVAPEGRKKGRLIRKAGSYAPTGATFCACHCSHGGAALAVGYILPPLRG